MTWGTYYFFYDCPKCGKKYRWELSNMNEDDFAKCPACQTEGTFVGETKNIGQGDKDFSDYEDAE